MKRFITTIKVEVYADTDEQAISKTKRIEESIKRKFNPTAEIDSIAEFRFYGFNNRNLDWREENRITFSQLWQYFKSLILN